MRVEIEKSQQPIQAVLIARSTEPLQAVKPVDRSAELADCLHCDGKTLHYKGKVAVLVWVSQFQGAQMKLLAVSIQSSNNIFVHSILQRLPCQF
jgi:hypothetical protein